MNTKNKLQISILLFTALLIIPLIKADGCCLNPRSPQYCWIDPDWTGSNVLRLTPSDNCCPDFRYNPTYYEAADQSNENYCKDNLFINDKSCYAYSNNDLEGVNAFVEPTGSRIDQCDPANIGCCCGCDAEGNRITKENLYRKKCEVLGYSFIKKVSEEETCTTACNRAAACQKPVSGVPPVVPPQPEEPTLEANNQPCKDGFDCTSQHCAFNPENAFRPDGIGTCQDSRANPKCRSMSNTNTDLGSYTCYEDERRRCYYNPQGRLATWRTDSCPSGQNCVNGECVTPEVAPGEPVTETPQTCSDNTPYNSCSATKPKYCQEGTLIDNCQECGCDEEFDCNDDGTCSKVTTLHIEPEQPTCNNNALCEETEDCSCADCNRQQNSCEAGKICTQGNCIKCPDFDGDGRVYFPDFLLFRQGFGKDSSDHSFESKFDVNDDGEIGFTDFLLFADNYRNRCETTTLSDQCAYLFDTLENPLLEGDENTIAAIRNDIDECCREYPDAPSCVGLTPQPNPITEQMINNFHSMRSFEMPPPPVLGSSKITGSVTGNERHYWIPVYGIKPIKITAEGNGVDFNFEYRGWDDQFNSPTYSDNPATIRYPQKGTIELMPITIYKSPEFGYTIFQLVGIRKAVSSSLSDNLFYINLYINEGDLSNSFVWFYDYNENKLEYRSIEIKEWEKDDNFEWHWIYVGPSDFIPLDINLRQRDTERTSNYDGNHLYLNQGSGRIDSDFDVNIIHTVDLLNDYGWIEWWALVEDKEKTNTQYYFGPMYHYPEEGISFWSMYNLKTKRGDEIWGDCSFCDQYWIHDWFYFGNSIYED